MKGKEKNFFPGFFQLADFAWGGGVFLTSLYLENHGFECLEKKQS